MVRVGSARGFLAGLVLLCAACGQREPIRLGFVSGLTGRHSDLGISSRNGATLAVDELNAAGGVRGRSLQLIIRDDGQDADRARRAVRELVGEGVVAMVGHATSSMAAATLPIVNDAQVLMVSPTVTSPDFTGKDDWIRQHEGNVDVRSTPGVGTTVQIFLPVHDGPANSGRGPAPERLPEVSHATETILLADDDDMVRRVLHDVLAGAGYRVLQAANGEEAVRLFAVHHGAISLCIFDVVMPRLNGREAREKVMQASPGTPVILLRSDYHQQSGEHHIYDGNPG